MMRFSYKKYYFFYLIFTLFCIYEVGAQQQKPNIIFILIDDMGWTDLGIFGSSFYETPNIDRLAESGMKFTNAYSACTVCSPSRAAILTGKYPARLHLTDWIKGHQKPYAKLSPPEWTQYLDLPEVTIAEVLKRQGYKTASIGKWHLGDDEKYYPENQGFDVNIAGNFKGAPPSYFSPYNLQRISDGPAGEYLTDRQTTDAIEFITQNKTKPFFLYLPYYTVHTPLQAKQEYVDYFKKKYTNSKQNNTVYAAMIKSLDENIGRLKKTLNDLHLNKNTLLVFTSDNGGLIGGNANKPITSNLPLRDGKGSAYEGGVRVPTFFVWEGKIKPGSVNNSIVTGIDYFPTFLKLVTPQASVKKEVDGINLLPAILKNTEMKRGPVYWHYPHYHPGGSTTYSAVRDNDWKLIYFYETAKKELYNLKNDISEKNDLSAKYPDITNKLYKKLVDWKKSVNAQDPVPNPRFDEKRQNEKGNATNEN